MYWSRVIPRSARDSSPAPRTFEVAPQTMKNLCYIRISIVGTMRLMYYFSTHYRNASQLSHDPSLYLFFIT